MNWDDENTVDELPPRPRKDIAPADLELLTLAARPIGARFEEVDGEGYGTLHFADGSVVYAWNPLVHRDDTFDLLVRLHMSVEVSRLVAIAWFRPSDSARMVDCTEEIGSDPNGATCRAVTRAAAEIGKAMG